VSASSHHFSAPAAVADLKPLDSVQQEARALFEDLQVRLAGGAGEAPRGPLGRLWARRSRPAAPVPGLYLWGGVGRGKTYLMDWFCDALPVADKRRLHFHHFMRGVHDAMTRLPSQPDPLEVISGQWRRDVRVLCLDEFVVTDIADAMILHRLLGALFRRGMTLVVTSNTRPEQLYHNGLQRQLFLPAIELLKAHTRVFELAGTVDYRLRNLTQAGVFFVGEEGDARLAEHYEHLTGGHGAVDECFSVNGRTFPARRVGPDVAWFDFQDLCGTPRAAADYIEIARLFHTVLLSGVPVLRPEHEAAARRFVHLIDEFYDRRIKLVIAADAPISELYHGKFVDFPFARVHSRLIEMQSEDYLAAPGVE
jgi:cell division protein ZapE